MQKVNKLEIKDWLRTIGVIAALIVFFVQAFYTAHFFDVTMDEGTYPLKGLLFLRGDYQPFQDYGLWTNKMPLSFVIPGIAQYLFEPGLRTGRYFSIFLSGLLLLGFWMVINRNLDKNWAAVALGLMALNSGFVFFYMQAISQVVTALLCIWSLYFLLGEGRRYWEILIGTVLAVMVVFTRQNMLPVLPLTVLFIFWQHGKKAGFFALGISSMLFIGLHLYFWPNIMIVWLGWIPGSIKKLFNLTQFFSDAGRSYPKAEFSFFSRFFVFWQGYRVFFALQAGSILAVLFWPRKSDWQKAAHFKAAIFCGINSLILYMAHLWASLIHADCLYCFPGYIAFFSPYSIAFVVLVLASATKENSNFLKWLGVCIMVVSSAGLGFSAYRELNWVTNIPVSRIRNLQILPGTIEIWRLLSNKYGWSYAFLERLLPALFSLAAVICLILVYWVISRWIEKRRGAFPAYWYAGLFLLVAGNILLSMPYPGGAKKELKCSKDVIASHEAVGDFIQSVIPTGSLIYWESDITPIPLLSIPEVRVFPGQLNHSYSKVIGGDPDRVAKLGYWNDELAYQWAQEANYLLIADSLVGELTQKGIISPGHKEIGVSPIVSSCRDRSQIHIYQKK
jgi:hypothetical protein